MTFPYGVMAFPFIIFQVIAIGPTTEAALKELGQDVFATAVSPSPTGLIQAIKVAQDKIGKEN